ncbi:MAG: hypothetical protein ACTSXO_10810 [Candidatus Heimdallarchaeota archaeon]|nr:MAG: hypothetical protein DRO63_03855 [Candidatus Gerdarchaeota archaeon]RLI70869.1 MAG: hypothetical protein DRP02_06585 [Candidatus Gerdarchaeota archaeon]
MSVKINTLDDYGFLFCFIGAIITIVMSFLGFIISLTKANLHWFLGGGYIGIANATAGTVIALIFGILALIIGLKLFNAKINAFINKMDRIIIAIAMIVIGIVAFGIGGILILVGGVLVLIYRLQH